MYQSIEFKDKQIHFKEEGLGKVLVFLHGFTESLSIWDDFSKQLSEKYKVISIDLPGHGESECIDEIHSMELVAEAVKAVLDNCHVSDCLMIGHSMGGYVSLAFAEKYPKSLRGIVLFHSSAFSDTPEAKENRRRTIEVVKQNHTSFLCHFIPDLFAAENREKLKSEIEKLMDDAKKYMNVQGIVAAIEGMKQRENKFELLKNVDFPVLFIGGKKDTRVPIDKFLEQIAIPKHSEALILDCGHMGYLEAPKETYHVIKSFAENVFNY